MAGDPRGDAHSDRAGGKIAGDNRARPDDAAVADCDAAQNDDAGAEPHVAADSGRLQHVRLVLDQFAPAGDAMVRGKDRAVHRDRSVLADFHSAMSKYHAIWAEIDPFSQSDAAPKSIENDALVDPATARDEDPPRLVRPKSPPGQDSSLKAAIPADFGACETESGGSQAIEQVLNHGT